MDLSFMGDAIRGFFTGVLAEMKTSPHTTISTVLLWAFLWVGFFMAYPKLVAAGDMAKQVPELQQTMKKLNATLIAEKLEREVKSTETDIFNLQREIEDMQAKRQSIPLSMLSRLDALRNDKARKEEKLKNFNTMNAALLEPTL